MMKFLFEIRIYLNLAKIDRTLTKSAAAQNRQQKTAQTGVRYELNLMKFLLKV